jgi:hypothetical protein
MGRRAKVNAKKRNRRIVTVSIVVAIIAVVVVLVLIIEASQNDPYAKYIGQPVSTSVMQQLTGVSDSTLNTVGLPSSVTAPTSISGTPLTSGAKPEVLYIGGEFCPFCAVERWSMIVALSHFGTFSGIEYMQSSSTDTNPNTPTFTFVNASFTSDYIVFVPVEHWDRNTQTLVTYNSEQSSLYNQYGTCPSNNQQGIPFIDIANQYVVNCGAQFALSQIAGDNWTTVASQLNTPSSTVAQEVDGAANSLITAICKVDGAQPASVCTQHYAEVTLAYTPPAGSSTGNPQTLSLLPQVREDHRWTD